MKTRILFTSITLGLSLVACDDKAHNFSAIQPTAAPPAQLVPQNQLPTIPAIPGGVPRGGRGGKPAPAPLPDSGRTPPRDSHDTHEPTGHDSRDSQTTRPRGPGPDISGGDSRDAGRRLDDPTCASFRALTGHWSIKVDDHWDVLNRSSNKWVKKQLEARAPGFFSDTLCDGLRTLRGKNARVAKQIEQKIGDKKLEILLTDDDDAGKFDKHRFHILWLFGVGKPQIKLGRRVVEGLIASEMPNYVTLLAPKDSQLVREPEVNRGDILATQIQAAKATFFHYVMHMAGAIVDKDKHTDDSFAQHRKELDVIHACTAQVFPYFYVDAEYLDFKGRTDVGPFYKNSHLACLACASADVYASGEIFGALRTLDQEVSSEAQLLCDGIKDHDPELAVTPDRAANLYEEMK